LAVVLEFSTLHFRSSLSPGSMVVDVRSDFEVFFLEASRWGISIEVLG
jgi:hypothetical protein